MKTTVYITIWGMHPPTRMPASPRELAYKSYDASGPQVKMDVIFLHKSVEKCRNSAFTICWRSQVTQSAILGRRFMVDPLHSEGFWSGDRPMFQYRIQYWIPTHGPLCDNPPLSHAGKPSDLPKS